MSVKSATFPTIRNMQSALKNNGSRLVRFSVSMPSAVVRGLDAMARARGFPNRSQALTALVRAAVADYEAEQGDAIVMGVLTLIYDHGRRDLQNRLTALQHQYLKEIITIQLVHLERGRSLQILLAQGPAATLRALRDAFAALKGVEHTTLQLGTTLLPPLHNPA